MGRITINGRLAAKFDADKEQLYEADPGVQALYHAFEENGIKTLGPSEHTTDKVIADEIVTSFAFGMFLWDLQKKGYVVTE